jgi:murein L,D-transpeptidase YcbB/YkuD
MAENTRSKRGNRMLKRITMICAGLTALASLPAMAAPTSTRTRHHTAKSSVPVSAHSKSTPSTIYGPRHSVAKHAAVKETHFRPRQSAPTADRVGEIQTALSRNGFYAGDPTSKWDANTVEAVQRFQQENGLVPSGKLDALTLQKLGLGSEVAGLSPPRPQTSLR